MREFRPNSAKKKRPVLKRLALKRLALKRLASKVAFRQGDKVGEDLNHSIE